MPCSSSSAPTEFWSIEPPGSSTTSISGNHTSWPHGQDDSLSMPKAARPLFGDPAREGTAMPDPIAPESTPTAVAAPAPAATPEPPAVPAQETTDWKSEARKWEDRAKENKSAAEELASIKEAQKTEQQKL